MVYMEQKKYSGLFFSDRLRTLAIYFSHKYNFDDETEVENRIERSKT